MKKKWFNKLIDAFTYSVKHKLPEHVNNFVEQTVQPTEKWNNICTKSILKMNN